MGAIDAYFRFKVDRMKTTLSKSRHLFMPPSLSFKKFNPGSHLHVNRHEKSK